MYDYSRNTHKVNDVMINWNMVNEDQWKNVLENVTNAYLSDPTYLNEIDVVQGMQNLKLSDLVVGDKRIRLVDHKLVVEDV